jgi:hypothetical protein
MFRIGQTIDQGNTVHSYLFVIEVNDFKISTLERTYRDRSFDYDRRNGHQTDFIFKVE